MTALRAPRPRRRGRLAGAAPAPEALARRLGALLQEVTAAYGWAHATGHGRAVTGDGGRGSGHADPTRDQVLSSTRDRLRGACRDAAWYVGEAEKNLQAAAYTLEHALDAVDPAPSANLRVEDQYRVNRDELASSREAKVRRERRGEGWGEG